MDAKATDGGGGAGASDNVWGSDDIKQLRKPINKLEVIQRLDDNSQFMSNLQPKIHSAGQMETRAGLPPSQGPRQAAHRLVQLFHQR